MNLLVGLPGFFESYFICTIELYCFTFGVLHELVLAIVYTSIIRHFCNSDQRISYTRLEKGCFNNVQVDLRIADISDP